MIQPHHTLNPNEVQQIAGCLVNVIKYSGLDELSSIDQIFSKDGVALLLFETQLNMGHWVCLVSHPHTIYFFDPYGMEPDNQLAYTNIEFRRQNDMDYPYLSRLLLLSPKAIDYNDKRLQVMSPDVQTCGYWCGYRMRKRKLTNDQFNALFKGIPRQEKDNRILDIAADYVLPDPERRPHLRQRHHLQ